MKIYYEPDKNQHDHSSEKQVCQKLHFLFLHVGPASVKREKHPVKNQ